MRPFWTLGAVPSMLLDELSLPRPDALAATMATLHEGRVAVIGGPAGNGRTTLALQAASALQRPAVLVEASGTMDADTCRRLVGEALGGGGPWPTVAQHLREAGDPVVILEDAPTTLADSVSRALGGAAVVRIGTDGTVPDPIQSSAGKGFLQRRSQVAGVSWTTEALDQAIDIAQGQPDNLQWLAQCALNEALGQGGAHVTLETLLEGAAIAAEHLPPSQALPIARLQGVQLDLLKAITRRPRARPAEWGDVAGAQANAVSVYLGRLVDAGLLERRGRGRYDIRSRLVSLHLQGRYGNVSQLITPARAP